MDPRKTLQSLQETDEITISIDEEQVRRGIVGTIGVTPIGDEVISWEISIRCEDGDTLYISMDEIDGKFTEPLAVRRRHHDTRDNVQTYEALGLVTNITVDS